MRTKWQPPLHHQGISRVPRLPTSMLCRVEPTTNFLTETAVFWYATPRCSILARCTLQSMGIAQSAFAPETSRNHRGHREVLPPRAVNVGALHSSSHVTDRMRRGSWRRTKPVNSSSNQKHLRRANLPIMTISSKGGQVQRRGRAP